MPRKLRGRPSPVLWEESPARRHAQGQRILRLAGSMYGLGLAVPSFAPGASKGRGFAAAGAAEGAAAAAAAAVDFLGLPCLDLFAADLDFLSRAATLDMARAAASGAPASSRSWVQGGGRGCTGALPGVRGGAAGGQQWACAHSVPQGGVWDAGRRDLLLDLSRYRLHLDRLSRGQLGEQQRQVGAGAHADLLHAQPARPLRGERVVREQQRAHALVGERVAAHVERIEHLRDIGEM